jgi:hypothetical protein
MMGDKFDWTNNSNSEMLARINLIGLEATAKELQKQIYYDNCDFDFALKAAKNMLNFLESL